MKLELLDAYNIRARLSAGIILLAPLAITTFLYLEDIHTLASSSAFIGLLLAFTNYIPILLRRIHGDKKYLVNYAAIFLMPNDNHIDAISKKRFYNSLARLDDSFSPFLNPNDSDEFKKCCESAVVYLRNNTRDNHLVQEENINHGLCFNLFRCKSIGIILCSFLCLIILVHASLNYDSLSQIHASHYFAFFINAFMLLFWCIGITKKTLDIIEKNYAKTLLETIDSIQR